MEIHDGLIRDQLDDVAVAQDAIVVHQGVAEHFDLVEGIAVLTRDHAESVDEVAVEDEGHVVEEERFEGCKGRGNLLSVVALAMAVTSVLYAASC